MNLNAGDDAELELKLVSPKKKKSRHKRKKRVSGGSLSGKEDGEETSPEKEKQQEQTEESPKVEKKDKDSNNREKERGEKKSGRKSGTKKDEIVSPVIPQPGAWKRPPPYNRSTSRDAYHHTDSDSRGHRNRFCKRKDKNKQRQERTPHFRGRDVKFQYGNYNRYYGYRNPHHDEDPRLKCFKKGYFQGKDVLDIGCNIGHITLTVAREFEPRKIVGLDIDRKLIDIAKKNIKHYVNWEPDVGEEKFPISMPVVYGPLGVPGIVNEDSAAFPRNVSFVHVSRNSS